MSNQLLSMLHLLFRMWSSLWSSLLSKYGFSTMESSGSVIFGRGHLYCVELRCWKCSVQLCQTGGSLQCVEIYWLLHLTFFICCKDTMDKMQAWRRYWYLICYLYLHIQTVSVYIGACGFSIHCRATISNEIVKAGPCHPGLQAPNQPAEKRMWVLQGTCRAKPSRECPSICFKPVVHPHPLARSACDLRNSYFDGGNSYISHVFQNCQD